MTLLAGLTAAAFAGAYLSAALGVGGGTFFIVLLYLMLPPSVAIPLHGAVQVINNGARFLAFRHACQWQVAKPFLIPVLPAIGLGWLLLGLLNASALKALLGLFVVVSVARPPGALMQLARRGWFGLGFVASMSSMLIGAADPVIAPFFLSDRFTRQQVIATKALCQLATHIPKVALFALLGNDALAFSYSDWLTPLAWMTAAVLIAVYLGKNTKLSETVFRRIYRVLLLVLGAKLLVDGASGWLNL